MNALQRPHRVAEAVDHAHLEDLAAGLVGRHDRVALGDVHRHGLFQEHVLPGPQARRSRARRGTCWACRRRRPPRSCPPPGRGSPRRPWRRRSASSPPPRPPGRCPRRPRGPGRAAGAVEVDAADVAAADEAEGEGHGHPCKKGGAHMVSFPVGRKLQGRRRYGKGVAFKEGRLPRDSSPHPPELPAQAALTADGSVRLDVLQGVLPGGQVDTVGHGAALRDDQRETQGGSANTSHAGW